MKENNINNFSFDRNNPTDITALYKFNNKKYEDIYPIILSTIGFIVDGGKEKFILKQFKDGKIKCIINKNIPARLSNIKVIKEGKKIKLFNIIEDDLVDILFNHANFIPFSPLNIPKCREKTFNLYTGNDIKFIDDFIVNEDIIKPILNHIKILTNNEEKSYNYVIKWLSKIIKTPERKTGVCPVFISDQGAGKTSFFEWFGHNMVGKDWTLTINNNENIFNRFNSELNNKLFTILDEAQLDGSYKKKADQLKSLITQLYQRIECKGIDSTIIDDKNNYVILTNNDFPVKVEQSDRRFAVFNVSNEKIGDDIYFKKLNEAFNNEDVQINFYHYLLNLDIKNFNPEKEIPETEAKTELKKESAPSPVRFAIDIIKNGIKEPELNFLSDTLESVDKFNTEKLYECYKNYMIKKCPNERLLVENGFILKLNKLLNIKTNKNKGNKTTIINRNILKTSVCNYFKVKDIKDIYLSEFEYSDSGIESDENNNETLDIYIDNDINICMVDGCNKNKHNIGGILTNKCMTHLRN
jgi:hypothetical protein